MSRIGAMVSRAWGVEQCAVDETPKLSYVPGGELKVENHGGISAVEKNELKFGSGIIITGENLRVDWIEKDFAIVMGAVSGIKFERKF